MEIQWNNLKVSRVSVLLTGGTDRITIVLKDKTAFPKMSYPTNISIETQQNRGVDWCKNMLGVDPEVINVRKYV